MPAAPLPPDETARQAALDKTGLVYTPAEERFDRVTRLAARLFNAPMAAISLIDRDVQWFKSAIGLASAETPRATSICSHALASGRLVVENALADPRFADNPDVLAPPHIRAYAGKTIHSDSGHALGTLCVMDSNPRAFTSEELQLLEDLSAIVEVELRRPLPPDSADALMQGMQRRAREQALDTVTRSWNHDAMVELLMREHQAASSTGDSFAVALLGLERMAPIRRNLGEQGTDHLLGDVAATLRRAVGQTAALGRYDVEAFLMVVPKADERDARALVDRALRAMAGKSFRAGALSVHVGLTAGVAVWRTGMGVVQLVEAAARALATARASGESAAVAPRSAVAAA